MCSQSNCTFAPLLCSLLSVLQCCSYSPLFSVSINLTVELPEYCYSILMRSAWSVTVSNKRSGVQTTLKAIRVGVGFGSGTETMLGHSYLNNYSTVSMLKKQAGCFNSRVVTKVSLGIINYCTKEAAALIILQPLSCCLTYEGTTCLHESFLPQL